jgi:hypothetical protein
MTSAIAQLHNSSLPTTQSEHKVKNSYMMVNINPAVSQQNIKTNILAKFVSYL